MLEFLFLLLLAAVIATFLWYRSFQEFTILQVDYSPNVIMSDERVPIVIRGIPDQYRGMWLSVLAKQSMLPVLLSDKTRSVLKEYASAGPLIPYHRLTATELAAKFHVHSKFKDTMTFLMKWWYLPVSSVLTPAALWILPNCGVLGLQRSLAERTVLTCHEGKISIWLSRETTDMKDILTILDKDPWTLSVKETPFINELQFVEVVLRAGNSLILPPRSLYGVRSSETSYVSKIELHSPLSLFISGISKGPI
jgi:hypothetical protein